jgi:hypothetical protein
MAVKYLKEEDLLKVIDYKGLVEAARAHMRSH